MLSLVLFYFNISNSYIVLVSVVYPWEKVEVSDKKKTKYHDNYIFKGQLSISGELSNITKYQLPVLCFNFFWVLFFRLRMIPCSSWTINFSFIYLLCSLIHSPFMTNLVYFVSIDHSLLYSVHIQSTSIHSVIHIFTIFLPVCSAYCGFCGTSNAHFHITKSAETILILCFF